MLRNFSRKLLKNIFSNIKLQNVSRPRVLTTIIQDMSSIPAPAPAAKPNNDLNTLRNKFLGQPTSWTHPHLLNDGEITPKIELNEYKKRRSNLMQLIKKSSNYNIAIKNHMVIIPSATKQYMSGHIPYVFRQNTDFNYFTGCQEPDSMLIITINEIDDIKTTMLMRPKDSYAELWDGPRTGIDNAIIYFGIDQAYNIADLKIIFESDILKEFLQSPIILWYDQLKTDYEDYFMKLRNNKIIHNDQLHNPTKLIHNLRVFKSDNEIELMRKTCEIASESINEVMNETKINDSEHHIFARIDYKCRMRNADYLAYPPVVASGKNATSIHYINNNQLIKDNDLILMDAGCEYGGYSSDITRTWPVNGEFTNAQRTLYDIILVLQKELISKILTQYGQNLDQLFEYTCYKLGLYLQEIGLIPKDLTGTALSRAGYSFCPHHVSHYLGMDVHDTPTYSRGAKIKPGMVFTVEPGIYIPESCKNCPPEFRGIGIRVEDDIVITSNGVEVLTDKCAKSADDIRNLIRK